ncbi:Major facilitator transporter [Pseudomonas syringae pv. aceris]|nr:Major facilitator transporter [Pseudomonas syringae pv. aceris]
MSTPLSPASRTHEQKARRAVVATVIGNGLEWFDFTVYSFFSVIIAKVFFPTGSELTSYLLALATFGVGFFMRPVGGIVLGIYSDKRGRKAALSLTILLMALGTLIIGLTPGFAQIGYLAPLLIVLARLLQGFSAGGEMGSATAFLTEHAPEGKKAFYSSWIQASIGVAVLLGSALGAVLSSYLTQAQLESWGWRVPFLIGTLIGPVGFYIRSRVDETPAYKAAKPVESPLREVIKTYPRQTLISFSLVVLWTVCTYAILFYIPSYAQRVLGLPSWMGFSAGMLGGAVLIVANPVFGLDFASVALIHQRLIDARNSSTAVLLLSEDLDELLSLADRIVVIHDGELVFETSAADADRTELGRHMAGAEHLAGQPA